MTTEAVAIWAPVVPAVMIALVVDMSVVRHVQPMRIWFLATILTLGVLEFCLMTLVSQGVCPPGWISLLAILPLSSGLALLVVSALARALGKGPKDSSAVGADTP